MNSIIRPMDAHGQQLGVYLAKSSAPAHGAIVVVQEIFGVNRHIRSVADDYAAQGFLVIAPALSDRVEPHLELGYTPADAARGMQIATQIGTYAGGALRGKKWGSWGIVSEELWRGWPLLGSIPPPLCVITVVGFPNPLRKLRAAPS